MLNQKQQLFEYYGKKGSYLKEHESFLKLANLEHDVNFLIEALKINNKERVLDIACGQGRHTNLLRGKGYLVDGVDFSEYLLKMARENARQLHISNVSYYEADIENMRLPKRYDNAYWFFSDLAGINISNAIHSIYNNIENGGLVMFDSDSLFRILSYLQKNSDSKYSFDVFKFELIDKKSGMRAPYPSLEMWNNWFTEAGFSIERVVGDYNFGDYSIYSPRLIIIVKKSGRKILHAD